MRWLKQRHPIFALAFHGETLQQCNSVKKKIVYLLPHLPTKRGTMSVMQILSITFWWSWHFDVYIGTNRCTSQILLWIIFGLRWNIQISLENISGLSSGVRYHGFLIEWIFYWIESSQIKIFESIFELNFPGKQIIEYFFELNIPEKYYIE